MRKHKSLRRFISITLCLVLGISFTPLTGSALMTPVDNITEVNFDDAENMVTALKDKIEQCEARGIHPQYEICKLTLIETYVGFLREDLAAGQSQNVASTITALNKIYTDADEKLTAYLNGTETPLSTNTYQTGTIIIDGDNLYATMSDGTTEKTYFVGYGHGGEVLEDMELLQKMGFNAIQTGITPACVIVEKNSGDRTGLTDEDEFSVSYWHIENVLIPALEKAEKYNMAVSVLLTPHDIPKFLYDLYPDLRNDNTGFQKYNIYHPVAKRILEVYADTVIPRIRDYASLMEICLINEPHYKSGRSDYDIPAWQAYLKEKYDSVEDINKLWKTDYDSFEDVIMPRSEQATPLMYEWVQFNDAYYAAWNQWFRDVVKENAPSVPVSAKTMSYTDDASQRIMYGVNMEDFDAFVDLSECNAWNTPTYDNTWTKLCAYDILNSVNTDKPIINSEDHIIYDSSVRFFDEEGMEVFAQHCYADVFQGAVHGRNAVMYWAWDRSYDSESYFYNSVGARPLAVAAMSEAALDVSRLNEEIDILNTAADDTEVYILFSDTSRVYSRMTTDYLRLAYEGALFAGKNLKIVSETTISDLEDGKLLIIPNCPNVTGECLSAIRDYLERGNEVLVLGECLTKDEYDNTADLEDLFYICANATSLGHDRISPLVEYILRFLRLVKNVLSKLGISVAEDIDLDYAITKNILGTLFSFAYPIVDSDNIAEKIVELTGESDVTLKDEDGKAIEGSEIHIAYDNDRVLVNVCNYDWDNTPTGITVWYKGEKVGEMKELISDKTIENNLTLEPHTPLLLEFAR